MDITIEKYRCLPCTLSRFKINNIDANISDFGERESEGSPLNNGCRVKFKFKLPTDEVLNKYKIDLNDYSTICNILEEEFNIYNCRYCS